MSYSKINNIGGWLLFFVALIVYVLTLEPTASLWDCGEYIATSYKLEVGHPPGAPFFMMMGRMFSWFVAPENVAYMINLMSALSSAFTILFLFWTITAFGRKLAEKEGENVSGGALYAVMGSGLIGALAYTFSDSFWFSAVEAEVYAMSSFFTAIVFWAIMKWERVAGKEGADRWLILILFLIGLSIGVHLLNLLAIPAIGYIYYFKKYKKVTPLGFIGAGAISMFILILIQNIIIPKTIDLGEFFERFFVNSLGMPFYSGTIFYFSLIVAVLVFGLYITRRANKPILNTAVLGLTVIMIGYSCFAMIVIRSNANPPIDENAPEDLVSLSSYLKREQYGDWPILYGQHFNSQIDYSPDSWGDRTPVHLRRFVVSQGGIDRKGFKSKEHAEEFASSLTGASVEEKYYLVNDGKNQKPAYKPEHMTFFPRMYSDDPGHVDAYKRWSRYQNNVTNQIYDERTGEPKGSLPTFGENLTYFFRYQVGWMYLRYFMWNFSGRQNDEQGYGGDPLNGHWQSGLNFIDSERLGDQTLAPSIITENHAHNKFFYLPLILGLIGFFFHAFRHTKDWFVILLLFLFTGFMIIIYLNQKPIEPRERDYAYAGSFYAFAMWIGLSVYGLFSLAKSLKKQDALTVGGISLGTGVAAFLLESAVGGTHAFSYSVLFISAVGIIMYLLVKLASNTKNYALSAGVAILVALPAPLIMGFEGWDDHDRSGRYTTQAVAMNYLSATDDQGIVFTNGDNDTFPLWYIQEVEGFKTSVRVCNLSLLNTDWYVDQMKRKAYESEPLPIGFTEEQYRNHNNRDYIYLQADPNQYTDLKIKANPDLFKKGYQKATQDLAKMLMSTNVREQKPELITAVQDLHKSNSFEKYINTLKKITSASFREQYGIGEQFVEQVQQSLSEFVQSFDYLPLDFAMDYLKDDKNLTSSGRGNQSFVIPARGFVIKVDKQKVIENNYLPEYMHDEIIDYIRFRVPKSGLYKADLMILEIINNNNWERPIYFASSASSSTYLGLQDHFLMEGLVYKFVPLKGSSRNPNVYGKVHKERMYKNMVEDFVWGNMDKPGTLIDYYNRRITNNYQMQFHLLAESYLNENDQLNQALSIMKQQLETADDSSMVMSPDGQIPASEAKVKVKELEETISENKEKAVQVLDRCMEVMPLVNLPVSRISTYISSAYFQADADEKGKELGKKVIDSYSENLDYYLSFDERKFMEVLEDAYVSWRSILVIEQTVQNLLEEGDPFIAEVENTKSTYKEKLKKRFGEIMNGANGYQYMENIVRYFRDLVMEMENDAKMEVQQEVPSGPQQLPQNPM